MSASTRTANGGISARQAGAALGAVALAAAILVGLAAGQLTASKTGSAPAGPAVAPGFDHGWSTDSTNVAIPVAPAFDHGASSDVSNKSLVPMSGASLQERLAQETAARLQLAQETATRLQMGRAFAIDTAPKAGEFRLAPGNLQPAGTGDSKGTSDHRSSGTRFEQ